MKGQQHNISRFIYFPERIALNLSDIQSYPLTIVEAPMGYGKTTSVKEFLKNKNYHVLWQRIHDQSISGFWKDFCRLFDSLDAECGQKLMQIGFPNDHLSLREVAGLIMDMDLPQKTILVLDDYHLINTEEVNQLIVFLIMNEINHLSVVLTARFVQFANFDELVLKGYVNYIPKETLEFTSLEINQYYKLCGINLKKGESDKLYKYTEGWISALYLIMIHYKKEHNLETATNIYKLIEKTVYEPFSDEMKEFMLTMCIFDSFTLKQAQYMWGKDNYQELLKEIISKNAFINYDSGTRTYQIHNLLNIFLKEMLEIKMDQNVLYEKAAHWFLQEKKYLPAMQYFYQCKDFDNLLITLEQDKADSIEDNKALFILYMEECPAKVKARRHVAMLIYILNLLIFNEMQLFEKTCTQFLQNMEADESLNANLKNKLLGEYEIVLSFLAYNDINKMYSHYKKAIERMSCTLILYNIKSSWTFGSPSVLYMFYRESGKLNQQVQDLSNAMPAYDQLSKGHGSGGEYVMEAERYFHIGDFENAEISIHKAACIAGAKKETAILMCIDFLKIRLAFVKQDFSALWTTLNGLHGYINKSSDYSLIYTVEMCEGFVYSLWKQPQKIPERIYDEQAGRARIPFPSQAMLNIVYGRTLLINSEYKKLIGSSEYFLEIASVYPNLLGKIYTYIYLAAANRMLFRQTDAMDALKNALQIAMPDQVYMPFVENCDYILPVLEETRRQGGDRESIDKIFGLYEVYQKSAQHIRQEYFSNRKPLLTERELEVAQLAAEGFSNKEISEKLIVSQNTVKTQLKSIFSKLGISSRVLLKKNLQDIL